MPEDSGHEVGASLLEPISVTSTFLSRQSYPIHLSVANTKYQHFNILTGLGPQFWISTANTKGQ